MDRPINVYSEIGPLKSVLLKRPGKEIDNLVPDYLARLLFDDIPFLPVVQKEHDGFAEALRAEGAEVLYLEKLTAEALDAQEGLREEFVDDIMDESGDTVSGHEKFVREYLLDMGTQQMVDSIMAGVRKNEVDAGNSTSLLDMMERRYPFYLDPMPNLYFTRDPAATIGNGFTINRMAQSARARESLFMQYVLKYHPRYAGKDIPIWLDRNQHYHIEGGDELVLSKECIAVGVSQRTSAPAIENLARNLFANQTEIKRVLAIEIPETRAFMHLDTVFTMVNYNQFTIHPAIQKSTGEINTYIIERDPESSNGLKITMREDFEEVLKESLGQDELDLIPCGGGDEITAAREQWNDGSNTLAIAPGVVVTYDRNVASNALMREHGIRVIEIVGSELVRGRGGPRCMSMPLYREDI